MNRRRRPFRLMLAAGIASALTAGAGQAEDGFLAAEASSASAPAAYVDRIIGTDQLQPLPVEEDEAVTTGLPRSYRVQFNLSRSERGNQTFDESGLSAGGFWETVDLGSFSLDANVFYSDRPRLGSGSGLRGAATLWQRNLYLDGGWHGDSGLGVLNTASLPLQRNQYRFFLPSAPFAGVGTDWTNDGSGLRLQASFGRAGVYTGSRVIGFDLANGNVTSLGAQWNWAPHWTGAAAFLGTQGRITPDNLGNGVFQQADTRALYAATAWDAPRDRWQFNLLSSDGDRGPAFGAWLDGTGTRGRYLHRYGAFRLAPGLSWGALPINNDAQGAYYRIAYQYARWSWNAGADRIRSITGDSFNGTYADGFARYQASSTIGVGGSVSVRRASDTAYSTQLFADRQTGLGQTRLQADMLRSTINDSWMLTVDQAFALRAGARLSTSLTYGARRPIGADTSIRTSSMALFGSRELGDRFSLQGSARWLRDDGPAAIRGLNLNLGIDWRLGHGWSLAGNVYQNQGTQRSQYVLDPLANVNFIALPRDRSVFLTLRYDRHAGQPQAVLGGTPGGAIGSINGNIYLDDNNDGVRSASEQVVPNLTVVLDGRYSVRSDARGNFEFPRVSAGSHVLTVVPDNLPLPWSITEAAAQRTVVVGVRSQVIADFGARRPR